MARHLRGPERGEQAFPEVSLPSTTLTCQASPTSPRPIRKSHAGSSLKGRGTAPGAPKSWARQLPQLNAPTGESGRHRLLRGQT